MDALGRPLEGVRILDLSRLLPGPYCTLILSDLGAEVIKVEDPDGGDPLRHMPPELGPGGGALFHAMNRGKKSVALDLRSEDGREAFLALVKTADVVVESFRPGVLEALGLSFETLTTAHQGIILCSITGFGQTGPDRQRAGHDLGFAARAGLLGVAGGPHGPVEAWPGVQIADIAGGTLPAAVGILAALRRVAKTGKGVHLDVSMTDGALALMQIPLITAWGEGVPMARGRGPLTGDYPCYGLYRTSDGRQMALAALEPKFWLAFCAAVGREDLEASGYDRAARHLVEAVFASRPFEEWVALSQRIDACLEPVWEGREVETDPQLVSRGRFFEVEDPSVPGGRWKGLKDSLGEPVQATAPGLGANTREVLEAAGIEAERLERVSPRGLPGSDP